MSGVIFKIDFEEAHDKVNWTFLHQTLRTKRFFPKNGVVESDFFVNMGIKVND
jgi:hypothetical protein